MISDKRIEIAERMRGPFDVCECVGHTYINGTIFGMQVCARDEAALRNGMRYLADLIDPTCHIVLRQSDSDFTDEPHYLCSRCGKEAVYVYERRDYTLAGIVSHARYCSYCGARVVSGNDAN